MIAVAARSAPPPPAGGGWQDRSDRGDRFERDERPSGEDRPGYGGDRPAYRSGPRIGGRDNYRPERRDDRVGRGSWQERGGRGPDSGESRSDEALASPDLLATDEELVAGRRPVAEAFAARRPAKRLLVVPERRQALEQLVLHATSLRIAVVEVEGGTLTSITGFDGHQGIALVVEPRRWATLDDVLARAAERGEPPLILVLDSLEDPQNVGTLLRTAEANGVHGVIFPTRRSAPISPAAIKTSAGATEHLLLVPLDDFAAGLVDLRSRGIRVVGADEEAQLSYRDADLRGPLALVVGSEGQGISGVVHRRLDLAVRIPMRGKIASLNAAVAGSVLLFEAASQRGTPETDRRTLAVELVPEPSTAVETADSAPKAKAKRIAKPKAAVAADEPSAAPAPEPAKAKAEAAPKPKRAGRTKSEPVKAAAKPPMAAAESAAKPKRARRTKSDPVAVHPEGDLLPEDKPVQAVRPVRATRTAGRRAPKATPPA